ncbi:MAG: DUF4150 domain-containing protein [Polyangiaceae bacterium]
MFAITTTAGGTCNGFPDVCKTPAPPPVNQLPLPYPNLALAMTANKSTCTLRVKILGQPVLTKRSMIPSSTGDEAGSLGGVVSGMIKGPALPKTSSLKVKAEGAAVIYQTCIMGQNGTNANCVGIQDSPSQANVFVMF